LAPKLPPTLHRNIQKPMPSCSKAPRGLSVLLRLTGIFTGSAISPSPSLRQLPDRYAIRAGRNLHDKEFRYHRTVHCVIRLFAQTLFTSPQRSDYIIPPHRWTWRIVVEDSPSTSFILYFLVLPLPGFSFSRISSISLNPFGFRWYRLSIMSAALENNW